MLNLEVVRPQLLTMTSAREIVHHILKMEEKEWTMVISFLWVCWDARNKINAGEQGSPIAQVLHKAMELACDVDESFAKR